MKLRLTTEAIPGWTLTVEFVPVISDVGIGAYEFWGCKGVDRQLDMENIEDLTIVNAEMSDEEAANDNKTNNYSHKQLAELLMESEEFFDQASERWTNAEEEDYIE